MRKMVDVVKQFGNLLKQTFIKWKGRGPFRESAIIAYYAIFSLPGLLVLILTVAGFFFGYEAASNHLKEQISLAMGPETA
ncbi:MAG TPA: ribonuclease BN, partial [Flavobacteriales bacterium]|nr:ribonuclease BN [Flavobacteriales bacterium]